MSNVNMNFYKKIISFCCMMLVCGSVAQAQCPNSTIQMKTQAQVNNFKQWYPNCTELNGDLIVGWAPATAGPSDITNVDSLHEITSVGGRFIVNHNDNLTNIAPFANLTTVGGDVQIGSCELLTDLTGLENLTSVGGSFRILICNNLTEISALSNLESIGSFMSIQSNDTLQNLIGLENITTIPGNLWLESNDALRSLDGLNGVTSIEGELRISGSDSLQNVNALSNLTSLGEALRISTSPVLTSISAFENLTNINGNLNVVNCNNLMSIDGLQNITNVQGDLNISANPRIKTISQLENLTRVGGTDIWIGLNDSLTSLAGLQNIDYDIVSDLFINMNPMLSVCGLPPICDYLSDGGDAEISNNAPGCNDVDEIISSCAFIPKVYADVFYDLNQDGVKNWNEPNYYGGSISISPGGSSFYVQAEGVIYIQPGAYTATFDTANNPNWQVTTTPTSYDLDLAQGDEETIVFGIYPTQQISDIQTITNSPPARCNESILFDIGTKNLGTTVANGTMWLTIDEETSVTAFLQQPDTIVPNSNTYGWYFDDLFPSQIAEKKINILVPGPPDFMLGDSITFETYADFEDANGGQSTASFTYETVVRCSFDPNDKLVHPNREGDYVLFEEDLIYTVRFQNTGNDVAYDVVIRDTLDANLDLSTFHVLGTSHANQLNTILSEDGLLTFEFRDIFLPDSTSNLEGSQGYVSYRIEAIEGLAEMTPITNSAGIYFDLNPPVITNTVQSIMVSELPTVSIEMPDNLFDFNVLPNPNKGIFTIQNIPNGIYQIHNTSGQIIQEGNMQNDLQIDISREAQGVYFISVTVDDATSVRRIVKM